MRLILLDSSMIYNSLTFKESLPEMNSRLLNVLYAHCSLLMQFDSVYCSFVVLLFIIDDVDMNSIEAWKTVEFIAKNHGSNINITLITFYMVVISIFRKVLQKSKFNSIILIRTSTPKTRVIFHFNNDLYLDISNKVMNGT